GCGSQCRHSGERDRSSQEGAACDTHGVPPGWSRAPVSRHPTRLATSELTDTPSAKWLSKPRNGSSSEASARLDREQRSGETPRVRRSPRGPFARRSLCGVTQRKTRASRAFDDELAPSTMKIEAQRWARTTYCFGRDSL